MSKEQLSRHLPDVVDARKMADHEVSLEGIVPVEKLVRLDSVTTEQGGFLQVTASFWKDPSRYRWLTLQASGRLVLECQRCLHGYDYPLSLDCSVMLVGNDDIAKQVPRSVEPVVLDEDKLSIWEVLVDEILLVLPQVSEHAPDECSGSSSYVLGPGEADHQEEAPAVENPFSVLAQLKNSSASGDED
ncbi:MAG: DUF177 domain-containing protein [Gammaproteobacteria bacterium]|nr:DUF177 domain-containing protein [Gammaproteobacteria bacterium]